MVVLGLENSIGAPTFEKLQEAVEYAETAMPNVTQAGLTADRLNLIEVIRQTVQLGLLFKYNDRYILTEEARNVLQEQQRPSN